MKMSHLTQTVQGEPTLFPFANWQAAVFEKKYVIAKRKDDSVEAE